MNDRVTVHITNKNGGRRGASVGGDGELCPECGSSTEGSGGAEPFLHVCPHCDHHMPVSARGRIEQLADAGSWRELGARLRTLDPLGFFDVRPYPDRVQEAQEESKISEALLAGTCTVDGRKVAMGAMDFRFLGGSMGSVVGERFVRLVTVAAQDRLPLIVVCASGGARMQEGILSLLQMAKTVVALEALEDAGTPFITVLTHPTTGGVLASFASLADVTLAEPGALLCFAGPRVIEQTTREKLPPDFGRSEANFAQGHVDQVVHRHDLRSRLIHLLQLLEGGVKQTDGPLRTHQKVLPWGGRAFTQAAAGAKRAALFPWGRIFGRDSEHTGPS